jgi:hypothetical protein
MLYEDCDFDIHNLNNTNNQINDEINNRWNENRTYDVTNAFQ